MPTTLRLCGQEVTLELSDPGAWSQGGMGRSSTLEGKIVLNRTMPKTICDSTLVHEIVHYILDTNGFGEQSRNEAMVSVLGNSLAAFLKDNPEVVAQLSAR